MCTWVTNCNRFGLNWKIFFQSTSYVEFHFHWVTNQDQKSKAIYGGGARLNARKLCATMAHTLQVKKFSTIFIKEDRMFWFPLNSMSVHVEVNVAKSFFHVCFGMRFLVCVEANRKPNTLISTIVNAIQIKLLIADQKQVLLSNTW